MLLKEIDPYRAFPKSDCCINAGDFTHPKTIVLSQFCGDRQTVANHLRISISDPNVSVAQRALYFSRVPRIFKGANTERCSFNFYAVKKSHFNRQDQRLYI